MCPLVFATRCLKNCNPFSLFSTQFRGFTSSSVKLNSSKGISNVRPFISRRDSSISWVQLSMLHNPGAEPKKLYLPKGIGMKVTLQHKLYLPDNIEPERTKRLVDRIMGPRGITRHDIEHYTGCKIINTGKGSTVKDPKYKSDDKQHVLIITRDHKNRAEVRIHRAVEEMEKLLSPPEMPGLPEAMGPKVTLTESIPLPVDQFPDFNFTGQVLHTAFKRVGDLMMYTGSKIVLHGEQFAKGDPLFIKSENIPKVVITVEDTQNRALVKMAEALKEMKKIVQPDIDNALSTYGEHESIRELTVTERYRNLILPSQKVHGTVNFAFPNGIPAMNKEGHRPRRPKPYDFTLKPRCDTVHALARIIRKSNENIHFVQFIDDQGHHMEESTSVDSMLQSDFSLVINNEEYKLSCCIKPGIRSANYFHPHQYSEIVWMIRLKEKMPIQETIEHNRKKYK